MTEDPNQNEQKNVTALDVKDYFVKLFKDFLDLDHGVDKWGTIKDIKAKQSMSGANAWMLMCSILIASIGLNLDSQAVIIGGMLISPLMSPILGIGLGVAINDKEALYNALMHFGAAIVIALVSSTLYFWLTPFNEFTDEIAARTEPTFLDILVAIFGGVAGIVSLVRKDISTTIPGVAIATALMPPLCVSGYGIATGQWEIATKSFYLFFLNSFFVALATFVILRQLRFPYKEYASKKERRKNMTYVYIFSLIVIIPSFLIFWGVYKEYQEKSKVKEFVEVHLGENVIYLDNYTVYEKNDGTKSLLLKVYGDVINSSQRPELEKELEKMGLGYMNVEIIPTSEINLENVNEMHSRLQQFESKFDSQLKELQEKEVRRKKIEALQQRSDFLLRDSLKFNEVCNELKIFYPEISEIGLALTQYSNLSTEYDTIPTVVIEWKEEIEAKKKEQLVEYLKQNFKIDTLKLYGVLLE